MNLIQCAARFLEASSKLAAVVALGVGSFGGNLAAAEVREAWVQRYNSVQGLANDIASSAVRDAAGDIIVAMRTDNNTTGYDILVVKFSGTNGAVLWQHRYDGQAHRPDGPVALTLDSDGNAVVAGHTSNGTNSDIYTGKYAGADGTLIWERRYGGQGNGDDGAWAVAVDKNGNVIVTGFVSTVGATNYHHYAIPSGPTDIYTAKYAAADGAVLWERRYDGPAKGSDSPGAVAVDDEGNIVVVGSSVSGDGSLDVCSFKYAGRDGSVLWERRYEGSPGTNTLIRTMTLDKYDDILVTGDTYRKISETRYSEPDIFTAKYSGVDGTLLWEHSFDGPGNRDDRGTAIVADAEGNVIATGLSVGSDYISGFYTAKYSGSDGAVIWSRWSTNGGTLLVLDGRGNIVMAGRDYTGSTTVGVFSAADGALVWERILRQAQNDAPVAITTGDNGEVAVVRGLGLTYDDYDLSITMLGNDGRSLWQQRFDGPANASDRPSGLVMDSNGDVTVTGNSTTVKYSADNGAELWSQPPGDLIAMDAGGNVFISRFTWSGTAYELSLTKYSPDGGVLWEQRRGGSAQVRVRPSAMTVDRDGNLIVAGEAQVLHATVYGADYFTAKYAAADGALLWENVYNGLGNKDDFARAVAVDRESNVFVTGVAGSSTNDGFGNYYTAKYAAADGRLLWDRTYFGLGNGNDAASAIAVDDFGNVIITGASSNGANTDYATLKYAEAEGATLWERRFNGPANQDDRPTGLAVDRDGNVVVTGDSRRSDGVTDFYTAKYEGTSGAVLWEKRYADPAGEFSYDPKIALDADGNAIVSGFSGGGYHTAKYAKDDGALLWDKQLLLPTLALRAAHVAGVAVGPDGMVAVTGLYYVSFHDNGSFPDFDYVTVVYRENQPPTIECPSNAVTIAAATTGAPVELTINATDDSGMAPTVVCVPESGAVFPIGQSTVTCTATDADGMSASCSFTVTVQGAQAARRSVLEDLKALRATISDRETRWRLDAAIAHLTSSLSSEFWVDEIHLQRKHGDRVFQLGLSAARNLCQLTRDRKSGLSDAVVEGLVDRLVRADRLLAIVAIEDAVAAGVREQKIEQAQKWVARGDADAAHELCRGGLQEYRQAWKRVARPSVVPIRHPDGRVRLEIAAEPGDRLVIQVSSNLRDWVTLGRCEIGSNGLANHDDRDARGQGARFYRVVEE
jgi:hypothetical protein